MLILNGKQLALERESLQRERIATFERGHGRKPGLAVVLVGDDPASHIYVRNKEAACTRVGVKSLRIDLPATCTQAELDQVLGNLNSDPSLDGILVQMPIPKTLSYSRVLETIRPDKDPDGLTYQNMGLLWAGRKRVASCTPAGIIALLKHYNIPITGQRAVVVGRSNIVGKPMAQLLLDENATVTIVHSKTPDVRAFTAYADLVVVAAGVPRFLGRDDFKKGAVVVDVGMHRPDGKLCGDVRLEELQNWVSALTPVPGGVGPMTISQLIENTLILAEK